MKQSVRPSWRAGALVPFAIALVAGSAVAGIASYYLVTAAGSSAHEVLSTEAIGAPAVSATPPSVAPEVSPAQMTNCQQVGVDQGDGEYGPLPIYSCQVTTAGQDGS